MRAYARPDDYVLAASTPDEWDEVCNALDDLEAQQGRTRRTGNDGLCSRADERYPVRTVAQRSRPRSGGTGGRQVNAIEAVREGLFNAKRAWFSGRFFESGELIEEMTADEFNAKTQPAIAALADLEALVQAAEAIVEAWGFNTGSINPAESALAAAVARVKGDT